LRDLVLIPGLNNTHAVFDEVAAQLAGKARCHSFTNPPLDSVDTIADELLPRLPHQFHLCGFSFGGYVAIAILARAPARVEGLALVGSTPFADGPEQLAARARMIVAAKSGYERLIASQEPMAFHRESLKNGALMRRRHAMLAEYGQDRYLAHQAAAISRPDRIQTLASYRGPTLFVCAAQDKICPPEAMRRMVPHAPHARFETIERSGHLIPLEQPAALAGVLVRWLGAPVH
jgi:pimeloyl-ACP methyl ester carboxylesterase